MPRAADPATQGGGDGRWRGRVVEAAAGGEQRRRARPGDEVRCGLGTQERRRDASGPRRA